MGLFGCVFVMINTSRTTLIIGYLIRAACGAWFVLFLRKKTQLIGALASSWPMSLPNNGKALITALKVQMGKGITKHLFQCSWSVQANKNNVNIFNALITNLSNGISGEESQQ